MRTEKHFVIVDMIKNGFLPFILITIFIPNCIPAQSTLKGYKEVTGKEASQIIPGSQKLIYAKGNALPDVIEFDENTQLKPEQITTWIKSTLIKSGESDLTMLKSKLSKSGLDHQKYQQTYKGLPIEGATCNVHSKNNKILSITSNLFKISQERQSNKPQLESSQALNKSLKTLDYAEYSWQNEYWEKEIKNRTNNPMATYYPSGQLMWYNQHGSLVLAYKFDIHASSPDKFFRIFTDANTGEILNQLPMESNCDGTTVNTIFNGTHTISTLNILPGLLWDLHDDCFNDEITIFDWNSSTCTASPASILSSDNTWTTDNQRFGGSVLYYTRQASNYWFAQGLNGYDDADGDINGYINAIFDGSSSPGCQAYSDNASMSFAGGTLKVGLGSSGTLANSWSTQDILGHEYTHAVTGSSAGLNYSYESGALNESFSDIFGEAIERFSLGSNDWLMGDERTDGAIRSMANPNLYYNPDTYLGTYWYSGSADNGGVHTNSGVQNFWFYLLSQGGSGTNDNGDSYSVSGLGISTASIIARENLLSYLDSDDGYAEARSKSIQAAIDIYGLCSNQVKQVTNAWYAVGVGNAYPQATATATQTEVCAGNTINLQSSGGVSYSWSGPNGFTSNAQNPSINNAMAANQGTYTVTATFSNGCTGTASVYVTVNPLPNATIGATPNPICSGNTLQLSSGGGSTYAWSGPGGFSSNLQNPTRANIQVSQSGIYTVTVTSAQGCTAIKTVNVSVNLSPTATIGATPNPICSGNTLQLSSGGGSTYAWSGPGGFSSNLQNPTRTNIQVSQGGTYTVTVTSAQGCPDTKTVNVTVNQTPTPTIGATPNPVCVNDILYLTSSGGASYLWSGPNGFSTIIQNPGRKITSTSDAGIYTVTVTSAEGCPATASINVGVNPLPNGTISVSTQTPCVGSNVQFFASGGVSYQWSGPLGFSSTQQNPILAITKYNQRGAYSVIITNIYGCSIRLSIKIDVYFPPIATASHDIATACTGSTLKLFSTGAGSASWTGPNGFTSNIKNPTISNVNSANSGTYTVTITSPNGCTASASTNVLIVNPPTVNASASDYDVCEGSNVQLNSSGGSTYQWSGPAGYSSNLQNPLILNIPLYMSGNYTVTAGGPTGCKSSLSFPIHVYPQIVGSASANPNPYTFGQSIQLSATGGSSYLWSGPNGFHSTDQNPVIYNAGYGAAGMYVVLVQNEGGCEYAYFVDLQIENSSFGDHSGTESKVEKPTLYPNPTSDFITISEKNVTEFEYMIIDHTGLIVTRGNASSGNQINVSSLVSGQYTIIYSSSGSDKRHVLSFIKVE